MKKFLDKYFDGAPLWGVILWHLLFFIGGVFLAYRMGV